MKSLLSFLNNEEYELIIRVSIFHYYFGYIHPFYDGNGRMNRLITSKYLYESMGIGSLSIAKILSKNKKLYYKMFDDTNNKMNIGDVTYFVYQFIEILNLSLDETIENLNQQNTKLEMGREKIEEIYKEKDIHYRNILYFLYQGYIIKNNSGIEDIKKYVNKSRPTVEKYLQELTNENKIKRVRKSRKYVYRITEEELIRLEIV